MYYTTGFTAHQITELCAVIFTHDPAPRKHLGRNQKLGLFKKITVTLTYLRRNRTQWELAEQYGVDHKTISNIVRLYTAVIADVLSSGVPTADDLDLSDQLLIDGTLLPCWSWAQHPEDYSGKRHTTGANVQVAAHLDGSLAWVCDPLPGNTHDAEAIRQSGPLDANWSAPPIGDKGYIGLDMITPIRKPPQGELTDTQPKFNTTINGIRYKIERAIANLKTWRILFTDYRHPHHTRNQTLTAVLGLESYKLNFS